MSCRIAFSLLMLCCVAVHAEDAPSTRWYVSADVGHAQDGVTGYAFGTQVAPRDDTSVAFRVRAGYQFVRFFALEASYADLGSFSNGVHMDCSAAPEIECVPDFRADIDYQALGLFGVGIVPLGDRLSFRATIGLSAREKRTHKLFVDGTRRDATNHLVTGSFGAGLGFAVTRRLDVYAEWNRYDGDDGSGFPTAEIPPAGTASDEASVEVFSLGVRWRF